VFELKVTLSDKELNDLKLYDSVGRFSVSCFLYYLRSYGFIHGCMRRLFTNSTLCMFSDGLYFDSTIMFSQCRNFEIVCPACLQLAVRVILRYERIHIAVNN
jgi:hypothetical protein